MDNIKKVFTLLAVLVTQSFGATAQTGYQLHQVPLQNCTIDDAFWLPRLQKHSSSTIPSAIVQLRDSTARIHNYEVAAGEKQGKFNGLVWDDSDVYKVMEGIAYALIIKPDPALEKLMDYWIDLMAKAQQPDGYLVTFYILSKEDDGLGRNLGPWSDIGRHEMYDGGHMIEAAIAYHKATGKRKFLDVAIRFADNWLSTFGPGKRPWVPGHQEAELALVKLYNVTNEKKYLQFANWLLEQRGYGHEFGPMWEKGTDNNVGIQSDIPVKDIVEAKGHAVRAMYMYSGMADIVANTGNRNYLKVLNTVWDDVVHKKMYITGGVGSLHDGEAFGPAYFLPNKSAYCETCASVGMVLWNNRMNLLSGDAKYANVLERSLYNAVLAGQSLSGEKFFYTNPLEADGKTHRGAAYGIACCPTNMARFIPQVGQHVYMTGANELFVNLFVGSNTKTIIGKTEVLVSQKTNYPWSGKVALQIDPVSPVNGIVKLRIPDWCKKYTAKLNGKNIAQKVLDKGYLSINRQWKKGDMITLDLEMPVELVAADPRVKDDTGKRAIQVGPIVYCAEEVDNPGIDFDKITLNAKNKFKTIDGAGVLDGIKKLTTTVGDNTVVFVPYYAWENRQSGKMQVWMNYSK
ncbi:MAG: glycoside hydrolase family 127 protein [Sphingobacteriaceae bacterium]